MSNIALRVRGYRLRLAGFLGLVLAFTVAVSTTAALSPSPSLVVPQGSVTPTDTPTAPCQSGIVQVNIQGLAFSPSNVTVCAGSQVKWTNLDQFAHTSTSDTDLWTSGTLNSGDSFIFQFDTPGVYLYHCGFHPSMHGTITVVDAAALTPSPTPTETSTATTVPPTDTPTATPTTTATQTTAPTTTATATTLPPTATPTASATQTAVPTTTATTTMTPTVSPTPPTCQSGVVEVSIHDFAFTPANVTVCAGSQVKWTNADPFPHTSTSDTGVWDSGTLNNGESFTFRFDAPGVYPYHCAIYIPMQGTITVVAGPPAHSIYLPHIAKEH